MSDVRSHMFRLYKQGMRITGVWPLETHKPYAAIVLWTTASLQIAHLVTLLINPLGRCPSYEFGSNDYRKTLWCISALTLQLYCYLFSSPKIPFIKSMIHDWSSVTDPREREIMIRHDKRGSLIFGLAGSVFAIKTIHEFTELLHIRGVKSTTKRAMCAFTDDSEWATINVILGFVLNTICYVMALSARVFLWNLFMHLSAQYKILKARYYGLQLIEDHKEKRRFFRKLVQRHNELFVLSKDLEMSFKDLSTIFIFYAQIYSGVFAVSSTGHIKAARYGVGILHLLLLILQLTTLFLSYYASDYLTACCEDVGEVFTQCNWYDLTKEFIINYSIVISRCQRPAQFTFMKMYTLDLNNFKHVLEALYSYISLTATITKDEK